MGNSYKNPYTVLGVSESASDEDIKKVYRTLAKKYHPDNFVGSPEASAASEKMKEINGAYDDIMKMRSGGGQQSYTSSPQMTRVRQLINMGRFSEADIVLDGVPQEERDAEWNFLKGVVSYRKGWLFDARRYVETACRMNPSNKEYEEMLRRMSTGDNQQQWTGNQRNGGGECSGCSLCQTLICADCCCECLGGDLIRCC